MYYVTLQHGGDFPHEIERLWCTVAANKRNVIPILEFLISRGLQEMSVQASPPSLAVLRTLVCDDSKHSEGTRSSSRSFDFSFF